MNIVLFTHPAFIGHQSIPRFTNLLLKGLEKRGHHVEIWAPKKNMYGIPSFSVLKKWLGYVDQYIIFPLQVRRKLKSCALNTLFVFTDNALGPWVPVVSNRFHVIHCHDFLAQKSALGEIVENPTSWTGRQYQRFIRHGYRQGKNFISVSKKTKEDLHAFLTSNPNSSTVVYNGLNQSFEKICKIVAKETFITKFNIHVEEEYFLHVGGNDWYKNKVGVIKMYTAWRNQNSKKWPLVLIGSAPSRSVLDAYHLSPYKTDIYFLHAVEDRYLRLAYCGAFAILFPSVAEGFGWPIAEAMASGCPVITTNEAPMTEVAGDAGFFIPRMPSNGLKDVEWGNEAAKVMNRVVDLSADQREKVIQAGIENAKRFDADVALDKIEKIYMRIISGESIN